MTHSDANLKKLMAVVSACIVSISLAALPASGVLTTKGNAVAPSAIVSEGVERIGADVWHEAGLRGQGVTIGILDSGFEQYAERLGEGELPTGVVTRTFRTSEFGTRGGSSGTVAAEIVFDLAPEAQFYLADTAPSSVDQFTQAVDWFIEQRVDVILYGRTWLVGSSGEGQGPLTAKIDEAADSGILWVNSAGDSAQRHWEGDWRDLDGCPEVLDPGGAGGGCLDFASGDNWNDIPGVMTDTLLSVGLTWDDSWDTHARFDYNLAVSFQERPTDWVSSHDPGVGGYPVEQIDVVTPLTGTYNVAITRPPSETGITHLELFLGWDPTFEFEHKVITGSIMTPADAHSALVVGAVHWSNDDLWALSSRGPTNDGRIKPDIVAPHGVSTVTYWLSDEVPCDQGGSGACGTGPAAAHAAGAAVLVKSAFPPSTPEQTVGFLRERALDLGALGPDNDYGWGRLQMGFPPSQEPTPSPTVLASPTATPPPTPSPSPTVTPTPETGLEPKVYLPVVLKQR